MDLVKSDEWYKLADPTHSAAELVLDTIDPEKSATLQNLILIHNVTVESIILRHPRGEREQPKYEIVLRSQDFAGAKMMKNGGLPEQIIGDISFSRWNELLDGLKELEDRP